MDEVIEALHEARVIRTLELALRDACIRRRFQRLRREMTVLDACEALAQEFYLSARPATTSFTAWPTSVGFA